MKAKIVSARGTSVQEVELKPQNWSGDSFRAEQKKRFEKIPKDYALNLRRGTTTIKAGDLPSPKPRPSTFGTTRVTNRGTASRKSKNVGSIQ